MANDEKRSFPVLYPRHWWQLRRMFNKTIPGVLSPNALASQFNMKEKSAANNILPSLRTIGLIDSENQVNKDLAAEMRDDQSYGAFCEKLRERIYSAELRETFPKESFDLSAVQRWFANETKTGEAMANRMAKFYELLTVADPRQATPSDPPRKATKEASSKPAKPAKRNTSSTPKEKMKTGSKAGNPPRVELPSLNLNIQIHIAADTPIDKVEQVFDAMRKRLYGLSDE